MGSHGLNKKLKCHFRTLKVEHNRNPSFFSMKMN